MAFKKVPISFWDDITQALVNQPVDERDTGPAEWRKLYGDWWPAQPPQVANALKIYNLVGQRQYDMWDEAADKPGELLSTSVVYAQFNSWDNSGAYITNTLYPVTPAGYSSGEPGYRAPPGHPDYYGPYWTQTNP